VKLAYGLVATQIFQIKMKPLTWGLLQGQMGWGQVKEGVVGQGPGWGYLYSMQAAYYVTPIF
jgi:hypothetical protein